MTATLRLRHLASVNPPTPEFDLLGPDDELSFVPLERVWPRRFDPSEVRPKSQVSVGYTRFRDGDIVVPKITPTFQADRTVMVSGLHGGVGAGTTELHVVRPGPAADPDYIRHLLSSQPFLAGGTAEMIGVAGQKRVPDDWLRNLPVPVTDLATQRRIADFLDAETTRIAALIDAKQQMISVTTERRRVLISTMVGRGTPVAVRRVVSLVTSGPRGWADRIVEEGSPFVRSQNLRRDAIDLNRTAIACVHPSTSDEADRSRVRRGDVLVGITGANTGWVGLAEGSEDGGYVSQHVAIIRPEAVLPEWLALSVFAERAQHQLLGGQYGGTKQQLGLDDLAGLVINVPSRKEQIEVTNQLKRAGERTSDIISTLTEQITLLQERRAALITAAVSGELEVG